MRQSGGWFSTTGDDPSVLVRMKEDYDGAEPSPTSVSAMNLLTLAHLTGERALRRSRGGGDRVVRRPARGAGPRGAVHGGGALDLDRRRASRS